MWTTQARNHSRSHMELWAKSCSYLLSGYWKSDSNCSSTQFVPMEIIFAWLKGQWRMSHMSKFMSVMCDHRNWTLSNHWAQKKAHCSRDHNQEKFLIIIKLTSKLNLWGKSYMKRIDLDFKNLRKVKAETIGENLIILQRVLSKKFKREMELALKTHRRWTLLGSSLALFQICVT